MNNGNALLYFHQGWTDIINCLPLINHYSSSYNKVFLAIREDSKDLVDSYCKNIQNLRIWYIPKSDLDSNIWFNRINPNDYDLCIHGHYDMYRLDNYRNSFSKKISEGEHFVDAFYTSYGLEAEDRIKNFEYVRNLEKEDFFYSEFIKTHGSSYILYHDSSENPIKKNSDYKYINIGNICKDPFEILKIAENAKEIHLIDSIWASFFYLLDCKYSTFKNIPIYLYPFDNRGGGCLDYSNNLTKIKPIHLKNWVIFSQCNVFAICGDSGSGKTTLSNILKGYFSDSVILECDRYHKWEKGDDNWKTHTHLNPEANYLTKMNDDIFNLKIGKTIYQVNYDHSNGKFTEKEKIETGNNVFVCGLHSLYANNDIYDLKIFIDTDQELKTDWKIKRDVEERGYKKEQVLEQINNRKIDYHSFVEPQRSKSDIIINFFGQDSIKLRILVHKKYKIVDILSIFSQWEIPYSFISDIKNFNEIVFENYKNCDILGIDKPHTRDFYDYILFFIFSLNETKKI